MRISEPEIIEAALSGDAGRLIFAFTSADKGKRSAQIINVLRRLPLEGLFVRIRLNPEDAMRIRYRLKRRGGSVAGALTMRCRSVSFISRSAKLRTEAISACASVIASDLISGAGGQPAETEPKVSGEARNGLRRLRGRRSLLLARDGFV